MEGKMDKKIKRWQILLALLFIVPCIFLSTGCSGSNTQGSTSSKLTCEVIFYTGFSDKFNLPKQEVKEGDLIKKPLNFPNNYQDEVGNLYQFIGWYSDSSRTEEYLWKFDSDRVHSNMTLYALWEKIEI